MSYSGDAAEQVVRMSLEGTEVAARITGKAAKEIAIMIYAVLKDQKKTKGKTRLTNMIRSGKELKVFAVQDKNLARFCKEAKKYGVLYCVLKDRDATDGITDVMVRAEDASKVNRIFERFKLTTVDMASVRSEIERTVENRSEQQTEQDASAPTRSREDVFLDALLTNPSREEEQRQNPSEAREERSPQSAPSSTTRNGDRHRSSPQGNDPEERSPRPSVRQELKDIRAELEKSKKKRVRDDKPLENNAPKKKKKLKFRKER